MPKSSTGARREFTHDERVQIIALSKSGKSQSAIAKFVKAAKTSVGNVIRLEKRMGVVAPNTRSGRAPIVTTKMKKKMDAYISRHDEAVPKEIKEALKLPITPRHIFNIRRDLGYRSGKGQKTIFLTERHKKMRLKFARLHQNSKFTNVIFSDEKPFELYKRRRNSYRKAGQEKRARPTEKYPPKIQCWGAISKKGKSSLKFWMGRPNSKVYCETLEAHLLPFLAKHGSKPPHFLQDRDTTHTSHHTTQWLADKEINTLLCPTKSPDLNAIEMVWNILEARVMKHNPKSEKELERWAKIEWEKIDQQVINNCIDKVVRRLPKVISSGGELVHD